VGITISAIIVILGSAFTLLGGAMMVFSSAFLSKANPASAAVAASKCLSASE